MRCAATTRRDPADTQEAVLGYDPRCGPFCVDHHPRAAGRTGPSGCAGSGGRMERPGSGGAVLGSAGGCRAEVSGRERT